MPSWDHANLRRLTRPIASPAVGGERDELLRSITELAAGGTPVGLVGEPGMGTTTTLQLVAGALPGPIVRSGGLRSLRHLPFVPLNRALGTDLASDPSRLEARLEAIVGRGVLIVDDLQWADPQTLASLPAVARAATLLVGIRLGDDGEAAAARHSPRPAGPSRASAPSTTVPAPRWRWPPVPTPTAGRSRRPPATRRGQPAGAGAAAGGR